jgi:hypothetical protein
MRERPPTVALVYVTLKSVQSSHFVLSSTVPSADAGIPKEAGLRPSGAVTPSVDELDELLACFGLITSRPTGSNTMRRTRRRAMMPMSNLFRPHLCCRGFSAELTANTSACFS